MTPINFTRRRFLKGAAAAGLVGFSAASAYAGLVEPFNYEVTETDIFIPDLPDGFVDFRVAHLTDIHHSRFVPLGEVRRVVALTGEAKPDIIVMTGDYTTADRRYIEPCAEALAALNPPEGVWAVLGNHDHHTDAALTMRAFAQRRINVLENANTALRRGGDALPLAGIDDWSWNKTDWRRALRGLNQRRPSVLLSHQPRVLDMAQTRGFALILSGHTHGGQVSLPLIGAPARFMEEFRYLRGLYEHAGTQLYVSRGTGMVGLPIRFGAPPEIALLRLRRAGP